MASKISLKSRSNVRGITWLYWYNFVSNKRGCNNVLYIFCMHYRKQLECSVPKYSPCAGTRTGTGPFLLLDFLHPLDLFCRVLHFFGSRNVCGVLEKGQTTNSPLLAKTRCETFAMSLTRQTIFRVFSCLHLPCHLHFVKYVYPVVTTGIPKDVECPRHSKA